MCRPPITWHGFSVFLFNCYPSCLLLSASAYDMQFNSLSHIVSERSLSPPSQTNDVNFSNLFSWKECTCAVTMLLPGLCSDLFVFLSWGSMRCYAFISVQEPPWRCERELSALCCSIQLENFCRKIRTFDTAAKFLSWVKVWGVIAEIEWILVFEMIVQQMD